MTDSEKKLPPKFAFRPGQRLRWEQWLRDAAAASRRCTRQDPRKLVEQRLRRWWRDAEYFLAFRHKKPTATRRFVWVSSPLAFIVTRMFTHKLLASSEVRNSWNDVPSTVVLQHPRLGMEDILRLRVNAERYADLGWENYDELPTLARTFVAENQRLSNRYKKLPQLTRFYSENTLLETVLRHNWCPVSTPFPDVNAIIGDSHLSIFAHDPGTPLTRGDYD